MPLTKHAIVGLDDCMFSFSMNAPKVLVIAPNWIGDMLMAQPLLRAIKTKMTQKGISPVITVMAPQWVAPVLSYMSEVDDIISTSFPHGGLQGLARWRLAQKLRGQFQYCYVLPNSWKSALLPYLAGIPVRIGYVGEMRYGLLNRHLPKPPKKPRPPMVAYYAALADLYDSLETNHTVSADVGEPKLNIQADEIEAVSSMFGIKADQTVIALCPGAEFGVAKRWPASHFAELARMLAQRYPQAQIVALGGPKDKEIAQAIGEPVRNLCGSTTLAQAVALLARAHVAVCNDSGLMHVRAALDRPQVAIFGSSDPRHTPPQSSAAVPLWLQLPCSPCHQRTCQFGHLRCLYEITPAQVADLLYTMLEPRLSIRQSEIQVSKVDAKPTII